ncbi:MAG: winged helix DNA-binding domain-containing protein [Chloroflexi bacterium]|nr:winged helix DNA-binding domain-containing protein [Chloroflexota bacterium]
MTRSLSTASLNQRREARYRRKMNLRVKTPDEAVAWINEAGFSFLFPIQNVEMPSLWDAIAGRVKEVTSEHHGYEIERTWGWKDALMDKQRWYYGKLLRVKATIVALDFLPNFYALSENYGDYQHDYLEVYRDGRLSAEAKTIYEALLAHGALDTVRLRKEAHMAAESSKARFERALTELQTDLKILPVGIAEAGAWRYAFVYEVLPRWLPGVPLAAQSIGRADARRAILHRYLQNVIYAAPKAAARVFGWSPADTLKAAESLAADGLIQLDAAINGIAEPQIVAA